MSKSETFIKDLLREADIEINGSRPWDIQVHNEELYNRVMRYGSLGFGEAYMDGWWDAEKLNETFCHILRSGTHEKVAKNYATIGLIFISMLFNRQNKKRAFAVGKEHYDIGNDLFKKMLDPWMQYSCGYWKDEVTNLNEAQEAKLDLIARKLKLKPGMRVLDVGCGWGGLSKYLSQKHGVHVDGITISVEQARLAEEWTKDDDVEILVTDYREHKTKTYDRIVSVGMFEHVGYKNYNTYMQHVNRLLKKDGIFLLHTIGSTKTRYAGDAWADKYIFPNGMLPSVAKIGQSIERHFVIEDWHNFGADYDKTLMAWYENFQKAWPELRQNKQYDERFYRMWTYYLQMFAGAFRARTNPQLWQIVLSKDGIKGGYESVR